MPRVYTRLPLADRFRRYVNVDGPIVRPALGPCHLWTGAFASGYGTMGVGSRSDGTRRMVGAHVVAFFIAEGRWPDALVDEWIAIVNEAADLRGVP